MPNDSIDRELTAFGNCQFLANVIIKQILESYQRAEEDAEHEDDNDTSFKNDPIRTTARLRSDKIFRRVQESLNNLLALRLQQKTSI